MCSRILEGYCPQLKSKKSPRKLGQKKRLVQRQQQEQDRLRSENKELAAKLDNLASGKSKSVSPGADKVSLEMAQIEARQAELSLALSQVEGLLQVKSQE